MPTLEILHNAGDPRDVSAGSDIFVAGEPGTTMFAVVSGSIDILVRERCIETVGSGGVFGEMALIDHEPRSATARATVDARIVEIDERRFLFMVQNHPTFAIEMMRVLAGRLRHMNEIT
jgi:CRP-like cAMP-binding protein